MVKMDADVVRELAQYAQLAIPSVRERAIAPTLAIWIANANALSKKMSSAEYSTIGPATVFRHYCESDESKN